MREDFVDKYYVCCCFIICYAQVDAVREGQGHPGSNPGTSTNLKSHRKPVAF